MKTEDAITAAQQAGVAPGDYITLQTEGQINHPHPHSRTDTSPPHVDGWHVANNDGSYTATKIHSDDR